MKYEREVVRPFHLYSFDFKIGMRLHVYETSNRVKLCEFEEFIDGHGGDDNIGKNGHCRYFVDTEILKYTKQVE